MLFIVTTIVLSYLFMSGWDNVLGAPNGSTANLTIMGAIARDAANLPFSQMLPEYLNRIKSEESIDNLFPIHEDLFNLNREYFSFFDIVIEYTCFCAIDPQRRPQYADLVSSILNESGKIIALFFLLTEGARN